MMSITSFKRPAALLGRRGWKILHTAGIYYLWLSFMVAFNSRLSESWVIYTPFVLALASTMLLRLLLVTKKLLNHHEAKN